MDYLAERQLLLWEEGKMEDVDEDVIPEELFEDVERLSREEYDVQDIIADTYLDLDQIASFLEETRKFKTEHDDKLKKLIRLLKSKDLDGEKVLIFTEFADTARYVLSELRKAGISGVDEVDSGSKTNRADIIKRFSPYYNNTNSAQLAAEGKKEIRVLISTDVLSEGLNLQDACRMINYDIHWNPVRIMQRIGRVDRRLNPKVEEQLIHDHPECAASRGKVSYWNFLPPEELNDILSLYRTVTQKTLLISKTLGIEGKKLLRPEDDYEALREFNQAYEGTKSATENMHLEYQALLQDNPDLLGLLKGLPGGVFSGRKRISKGTRGIFFCFALPALDKEKGIFTEEAGITAWYLYDLDKDAILEDVSMILENIRSKQDTPRICVTPQATLSDIRVKILNHIKDSYLKRVNAPVGVKAALRCWMELN
jgi:hypothetical protein